MEKLLFTSESAMEGHPDKMRGQISDTILDVLLEQDPMSHVVCETAVTTGLVMVIGEITIHAYVDMQKTVREIVREIGYDRVKYGSDCDICGATTAIDEQSADIVLGVDRAPEAREHTMSEVEIDAIGADDQGMVFGSTNNETEEYIPYPVALAHRLARQLTKAHKDGTLSYLRSDGRTQVMVECSEDGRPIRLDTVVPSAQHGKSVTQKQIRKDIRKHVFNAVLPAKMVGKETRFSINPTGRFVTGGPHGDSGLTGRRTIADTYGGYACYDGDIFSGEGCTKTDRLAAYAARYVAKNIVAASLVDKREIRLSYAIGVVHPISIMADTLGTGRVTNEKLVGIIRESLDLRLAGIIKMLNLRGPIYRQTTVYGHPGRNDLGPPWGGLDKTGTLKKYL